MDIYICCVNSSTSRHANILIRDQLEVHVLQNNCKCYNCLEQCKLITNALAGTSAEWNESAAYAKSQVKIPSNGATTNNG